MFLRTKKQVIKRSDLNRENYIHIYGETYSTSKIQMRYFCKSNDSGISI